MRGEHPKLVTINTKFPGSSPHARGAPLINPLRSFQFRIIPACAGSTTPVVYIAYISWDHPRMRGEHIHYLNQALPELGSSPHARGARSRRGVSSGCPGIIPACAGSTNEPDDCHQQPWDHPRMRGEHLYPQKACFLRLGSSPHARGARDQINDMFGLTGIIPACAGSTTIINELLDIGGDHPRMRGEHHY